MVQAVVVGKKYRFDYPQVFTTLPEYTAHAGQMVQVLRPLTLAEAEPPSEDMEGMFKVRADDGWTGDAFESELVDDPEPPEAAELEGYRRPV